jgi:hypothetical protein
VESFVLDEDFYVAVVMLVSTGTFSVSGWKCSLLSRMTRTTTTGATNKYKNNIATEAPQRNDVTLFCRARFVFLNRREAMIRRITMFFFLRHLPYSRSSSVLNRTNFAYSGEGTLLPPIQPPKY